MLRWLRQLAPPVVAIALIGFAPIAAKAALVTYSTSGVFTAAGTDNASVSGDDSHLETASAQTTLDYLHKGPTNLNTLPSGSVSLGTVTMNASAASQLFDAGDLFTLTIKQTFPGNVNGSSSASIVGSVTFTPATSGGTDAGTLSLAFSPNPVVLNGIYYLIKPFNLNFSVDQPGGAVGTIQATVAAVPLPQTATMGIALIGCVGGIGAWRRMKSEDGVLA